MIFWLLIVLLVVDCLGEFCGWVGWFVFVWRLDVCNAICFVAVIGLPGLLVVV